MTYDRWHGQWLLDRDGHRPRFPFGFGLSYTSFDLSAERLDDRSVRVEVCNTGEHDGAAVVFLFRGDGPTQRLVAFRRIEVPAGRSARVDIESPVSGPLRVARYAGDTDAVQV